MTPHHMTEEEKEYLKQYDITQFERPSIATDMAVFSIMGKKGDAAAVRSADNYRKLPEKKLKILLIRRASFPYKDCWALPGGFCRNNEDVYETARREFYEETNVKDAYLKLAGIFGDVGRDPRGWIISHTFLALMDGEKCRLRAGSDAWEARWFDIRFEKQEVKRVYGQDTASVLNEYRLYLTGEETESNRWEIGTADSAVRLHAVVQEYIEFRNYHETVRYELADSEGFAFDHAKLLVYALLSLRQQAEGDGKIVFDLMPELFTLTELQKAFEIILDKELLVANFRRKMAGYVAETEQMIEGAGHRPAKLFKRNVEAFYEKG